jgi:hypothetical protein
MAARSGTQRARRVGLPCVICQQAIQRIDRRRRFWIRASVGTLGMIIVVVVWALTEYHNAGGWPTNGFSQSSGIHDVWNYWIIYPAIAWVLLPLLTGLLPAAAAKIIPRMVRIMATRPLGPGTTGHPPLAAGHLAATP